MRKLFSILNSKQIRFFYIIVGVFFIVNTYFTLHAQAEDMKQVLILNSYDESSNWTSGIEDGIKSVLKGNEKIELHYEFMDSKNKKHEKYLDTLYDIYKNKYLGMGVDTIICSDNDALNFLIKRGKNIFGDCPIVFCGINDFDKTMLNSKTNITGIVEEIDVKSTLDSIFKVQPNTKNIIVITDTSTTGKINERLTKKAIEECNVKFNSYFCKDMNKKSFFDYIEKFPKDTIVLDVGQLRRMNGELIPFKNMGDVLKHTELPIYGCWSFLLKENVIGGKVISAYNQGEKAGEIALKILNGEKVSNIPIVTKCEGNYVFNYNQLKKNKIDIKSLPKKYSIINKPFSFYECYKKLIFTTFIIIITLVILIVILTVNIKKRIEVQRKLTENYDELNCLYEELSATEEELKEQYNNLEMDKKRIHFLAYHDQLTGLYNRTQFIDDIKEELSNTSDEKIRGAILYMDIDNFKDVNDTLGHDYGNELLKQVCCRIRNELGDRGVVYRLGGDEFAIIQFKIKSMDDVKNVAKDILSIFKKPFKLNNRIVFTSSSIGISLFPEDGFNGTILLKNADTAMYKAKESGRNTYLFYNICMFKEIMRKSQLEQGIRKALKNGELKLHYQPKIGSNDKMIKGAEVLLRWESSRFGFVSPIEFIPILEKTLLIIPIGKWILKNACLKIKKWIDEGFNPVKLSVNVSVIQLQQYGFVDMVKEILNETKVPPEFLDLEITESVIMKYTEKNIETLNKIRELGVTISLDDFGTGYSSLSYLRVIPINTLKLDKSFIDNIIINRENKVIVEELINLAHKIGLYVVAEGVEKEDQFKVLKNMKCDEIQGYYFSKPLCESEFEEFTYNNLKITK